MRKRNIDKHIWFSRDEAQDLQRKAKKCCLTEGAVVRLLVKGYEPKEKPDDRFYDAMRELHHGDLKSERTLQSRWVFACIFLHFYFCYC